MSQAKCPECGTKVDLSLTKVVKVNLCWNCGADIKAYVTSLRENTKKILSALKPDEKRVLSKDEARLKLKEAKENLDLELISQKEYDVLKEQLKPLIFGDDNGISNKTKYYSFDCTECGESMNIVSAQRYGVSTNYRCPQCLSDNWMTLVLHRPIPKEYNFKEIQHQEFVKTKIPIIEPIIETKEKKKRSLGMKLLMTWFFGTITYFLMLVVNPNLGVDGSDFLNQIAFEKQFGTHNSKERMNRMFPRKETPTQNVLSSVVAILGVIGIYRFIWKD